MFTITTRPRHPASYRLLVLMVAAGCALAACKKEAEGPAAPGAADAPAAQQQAQATPPAQAVSAEVAAMSADQLRDAASTALREQRLYAPAGNNAMEYYLALRDKQPSEPAVASALTDLLPYALIATEQSISREDFQEAQRLLALMEKADPKAPALPRLKQGIESGQAALAQRAATAEQDAATEQQRQAEVERQRLADQQRQQQEAARQLQQQTQQAEQQAAAQRAAAEQQAAAQRAAEQRAAEQRAAEQRAAQQAQQQQQQQQQAARPAAPAPAPAASSELRAVSTPAPRYPPEALRGGESGEVVVEFTVGTNGQVTSARVVSANPPRVFDRAALNAVRRWTFQPVSSPVTTRRTIGFNPG